MQEQKFYTYKVINPIKDYGFNKEIGDFMTTKELLSLPPFYMSCVKLLNSPIKIK